MLEPSSGVIRAKMSQEITVRIYPQDASVYVSEATCVVGEGKEKWMVNTGAVLLSCVVLDTVLKGCVCCVVLPLCVYF